MNKVGQFSLLLVLVTAQSCCSPPSRLKSMSPAELRAEHGRIWEELSSKQSAAALWHVRQAQAVDSLEFETKVKVAPVRKGEDPDSILDRQRPAIRDLLRQIDKLEREIEEVSSEMKRRGTGVPAELRAEHDRIREELVSKVEAVSAWYAEQARALVSVQV